jgi:hypothetical protein
VTHPSSYGGNEELRNLLSHVVGSQIVSVSYLIPSGVQWSDGREDGRIHEVDHGVELALSNGLRLAVYWEMEGEDEYLSISATSLASGSDDNLIDAVDVSDVPKWSSKIGRTIRSLGIAWHVANLNCPNSVWALRFDLEDHSSFVISLGEIRNGAPTYLPDSVLVLFEKEDAESYRTAASTTSAWGSDFPLA